MGHCHYHCHKTSSSRSRRINLSTLPRSNLNPYPSTRTQGTWFTVTEPSKSTCHKGLSSSIRVLAGKQFWCKVYVGSREAFIAAVHRSNVESWPWNCPTCVCVCRGKPCCCNIQPDKKYWIKFARYTLTFVICQVHHQPEGECRGGNEADLRRRTWPGRRSRQGIHYLSCW